MNKKSKYLALFLALCICASCFPVFAVDGNSEEVYTGEEINITVGYSSYIPEPVSSGNTNRELSIINTTGGELPVNTGNTSTYPTSSGVSYLYLDEEGYVDTEDVLTSIYRTREWTLLPGMSVQDLNELYENRHYLLSEIWLKNGDSYKKYAYDKFNLNTLQSGAELVFIYSVTEGFTDVDTEFYDYDISNGWVFRASTPTEYKNYLIYKHKFAGNVFDEDNNISEEFLAWATGNPKWEGDVYTYTKESGINNPENYSSENSDDVKFAFGNVNTGTGLGRLTYSVDGFNNELNKYNNRGFAGCTFGIPSHLDDEGKIVYNSGLVVPNLFNEGDAIGKTTYHDYPLSFHRIGDTYTLSRVRNTSVNNCEQFINPSNSQGFYDSIWTNNFWPMDDAPSFGTGYRNTDSSDILPEDAEIEVHDIKFGASETFKDQEHEIRFGPITEKPGDYTYPESDDGLYHNSYFGMHFEIPFYLDEEYCGPLEYTFFGDDDLWVFLDGELICDIGGIHSSVGENVSLWDYLGDDNPGEHLLSFFYTERGASGSTCWMQFTIPRVLVPSLLNTSLDSASSADQGGFVPVPPLTLERQADLIVSKLTTNEKIGQCLMIQSKGSYSELKSYITKYKPGGFVYFGADYQNEPNASTVLTKTNALQTLSRQTDGIPLLISVDEEGGLVTRISRYPQYRSSNLPSALSLKRSKADIYADGEEKARLLSSVGANVNLAPVADWANDPNSFLVKYERSWGGTLEENSNYVAQEVKGMEENGIGSCLKHFPGYGDCNGDTHYGIATIDKTKEELLAEDTPSFLAGIEAGSDMIMVTHNTYTQIDPDSPASLSPEIYTMLREDLNFDGIAVTDSLEMGAITNVYGDNAAAIALQAGADMAMIAGTSSEVAASVNAVRDAVYSGLIPEERIDEACRRVILYKLEHGLKFSDQLV